MKRLLLSLILIVLLSSVGLFADGVVVESEGNDTDPVADPIPSGDYTVGYAGEISTSGNSDWAVYRLDFGDRCTYHFDQFDSVNLRVDIYTDNPPTNVVHTLIPGETYTYDAATYTGFHYIRVYTNPDTFPVEYFVRLTNLDSPTLPVTLSAFTAMYSNNGVGITWTTQSETNLAGFNLIRSENSVMSNGISINGPIILAHNTSSTKTYTFKDEELEEVGEYFYWLETVEIDGGVIYHGPVNVEITEDPGGEGTPDANLATMIKGSFPNPFSSSTSLEVQVSKSLNVELSVYNIRGEKVNIVHNGQLAEGDHSFSWNGKDIHGRDMANGIYFLRLNTYEGTYTHKMTYIK